MQSSNESQKQAERIFCLVVPTYNESDNIGTLIERVENQVPTLPLRLVLFFVDDNSEDGTADIIKRYMEKFRNILLLQRPKLAGLGSAYIDGFKYALRETNAEFLGEMDADLQHPPETLVEMCKKACEGNADVVLGSRYIKGGGASDWSLGRRIISKGANTLSRVFLRIPVADSTTGFRLISSTAVRALLQHKVSAKGYAFQVESLYVYKKEGFRFAEVPYFFSSRKGGKTKLDWKEIFRFASVTIRTGIVGVSKQSKEDDTVSRKEQNVISK